MRNFKGFKIVVKRVDISQMKWQNISIRWIYIYIFRYPQRDCFVESLLFGMARHVRYFKLRSKPRWVSSYRKAIVILRVSEGILRYIYYIYAYRYWESSIYEQTNVDYPSNSKKCTCKKKKNTWGNNIICRLLQGLSLRGKMRQILLAYGLLKETVADIMMLYKNMKVKVSSPDGDTDYFDIVAGFKLAKERNRRCPA